jgi:cell division protein FtsL
MKTNAAYNLSIYENEPEIKMVKAKKPPRPTGLGFSPKMVLFALVIAAIGSAFLYTNAMMNEVFNDIRAIETEIKTIEAERTRLEMEIESRQSLRNIEEYAKKTLGMNKIQKYQTEHIDLSANNTVILLGNDSGVTDDTMNPLVRLYTAVKGIFSRE